MIEEFFPFLIYIVVLILIAIVMVALSHLLSPKRVPVSPEWGRAYECGLITDGLPQDRYPIKYYLVAILFVIFDLEAIFLYPWAVTFSSFKESGNSAFWFIEMFIFIFILLVGYLYIVSKGVFLWSEEE